MALDFNNDYNGDLIRTTTLPSSPSVLTMMLWAQWNETPPSSYEVLACMSTASAAQYRFRSNFTGRNIRFYCGAAYGTCPTVPDLGEWFHVAVVASGSGTGDVQGYYNGSSASISAVDGTADSSTRIVIGANYDEIGEISPDMCTAHFKLFDRALSVAEVQTEMRVGMPRAADCIAWVPMQTGTDYRDLTGHGDFANSIGAPLTADGPPVSWGGSVCVVGLVAAGESASLSPSASGSASLSPSASMSPSIAPLDAVCWGEETPDAGEEAQEWPRWQTAADTPADVTGDPDWGAIEVADGSPTYGNVIDTGDGSTKTFTVTKDKYDTGSGSVTIYIRGSATTFGQHDGSPSWNLYTVPTAQAWRYVQLRMDYA